MPTTPLRIHGADPVETVPSPKLGQHNREIYGDWLRLGTPRSTGSNETGLSELVPAIHPYGDRPVPSNRTRLARVRAHWWQNKSRS